MGEKKWLVWCVLEHFQMRVQSEFDHYDGVNFWNGFHILIEKKKTKIIQNSTIRIVTRVSHRNGSGKTK